MNYIGEFQKDSTILLELLTKDEENQPIATDFPPTATIEHYDRNGLQEVDNVTLETMGDGSRHTKVYQIPPDLVYGDYIITYKVSIDGLQYTTQEKFYISRTEEMVTESNILAYDTHQMNKEILDLMKSYTPTPTEEEPEEEPITSADGYVMPHDFQIPSVIQIADRRIIITLAEPMKYNHTYRVVLDKRIRAKASVKYLDKVYIPTFTSEYKPLLATPLEVQMLVRSIYKYFTPHDVHTAIRDAGQKAFQLLGRVVDANNSRYREYTDRETSYFPATKYVTYEAARMLMTGLMVRILNGASDDEVGAGMMNEIGGSITLGDFSISDKSSSSSGIGGTSSDVKEESPLRKLQVLIEQTEKDMKFWLDAMMGQNRRGYGKPLSGSYRSGAGSPEGRDF